MAAVFSKILGGDGRAGTRLVTDANCEGWERPSRPCSVDHVDLWAPLLRGGCRTLSFPWKSKAALFWSAIAGSHA